MRPRFCGGMNRAAAVGLVAVVQETDSLAPEEEPAFASYHPRHAVFVAWRAPCIDDAVARRGLAPFDEFEAHGRVSADGPTTPVATVSGAGGAPIAVLSGTLET